MNPVPQNDPIYKTLKKEDMTQSWVGWFGKIWQILSGTIQSLVNADKLDSYHASEEPAIGEIPVVNESGDLAVNAETAISSVSATNADTVDTFHASQTPTANTVIVANSSGKISIGSGWIPYYESAEQTITSAGSLQLAHGLGVEPLLVQCLLVCKTTEANYSVDDKVFIQTGATPVQSGTVDRGISIVPDATNLNIRYGADATNVFTVLDKTTGGAAGITTANWKLIVRAWA